MKLSWQWFISPDLLPPHPSPSAPCILFLSPATLQSLCVLLLWQAWAFCWNFCPCFPFPVFFFFVVVVGLFFFFFYSSGVVTLPPHPNSLLQHSHRGWKAAVFPHVSWHLTTSPSAKQRAACCLISGSKIQLLFKLPMDSFQATAQIKPVSTPFPTTSFSYRTEASSFFLNFIQCHKFVWGFTDAG